MAPKNKCFFFFEEGGRHKRGGLERKGNRGDRQEVKGRERKKEAGRETKKQKEIKRYGLSKF